MDAYYLLYLLIGIITGNFLAKFLPAFFNPKEHMLSSPPANNEEPQLAPEELEKEMEEMMKLEEFKKLAEQQKVKFPVTFKASRLRDTFTPDIVIFNEKGVTFIVRTLFEAQDNFLLYSDISGVELDEKIFFASIKVKPKIRGDIVIHNFTKRDAQKIKEFIVSRL